MGLNCERLLIRQEGTEYGVVYIRVDRIIILFIALSDRGVVFARDRFGQVEHMHLFMQSFVYANFVRNKRTFP